MRRTIHLCERGINPPVCKKCGQVASAQYTRRQAPVICVNESDWETIYVNHPEYRRCIDKLDVRDRTKHKLYPTPTEPGYYWAEWRIAEDGTWPEPLQHYPEFVPGVVQVIKPILSDSEDFADDSDALLVAVPGIDVDQKLENFVWRSAKLTLE